MSRLAGFVASIVPMIELIVASSSRRSLPAINFLLRLARCAMFFTASSISVNWSMVN